MSKTEVINTRVDPALKKAAEAVFAQLGMTTADGIRLFLKQVEMQRGLPFEVKIPNAETLAALKESEDRSKLTSYESFEALCRDIGIDPGEC